MQQESAFGTLLVSWMVEIPWGSTSWNRSVRLFGRVGGTVYVGKGSITAITNVIMNSSVLSWLDPNDTGAESTGTVDKDVA